MPLLKILKIANLEIRQEPQRLIISTSKPDPEIKVSCFNNLIAMLRSKNILKNAAKDI